MTKTTKSTTLASTESLDNRILLQTLEREISKLEKVISALEFEGGGQFQHRNNLQEALKERCQIYSSLHKDRDISLRHRI
ncbi:hypothetical protein [Sessilibacter corallicola]|uniref:Uncharacterized protein n=1 Tax=Sessilibacter corallicola TaxID=2904075 RepID=A0ABQ0A4K1_9GAMM|nr:hypothetical protein [Sessilibacter corallicola]MCE2026796.1 hypothetical protein [Sessilibacter corallicola]